MSKVKKLNHVRTIIVFELGGSIYKIGSCPLRVWEEFESLSPDNKAENIINNTLINHARISIDLAILCIKHYNKTVDLNKIKEDLYDLTVEELEELWGYITETDKALMLSSGNKNITNLSDDEIKDLKKKKII